MFEKNKIIQRIVEVSHLSREGHIGSSLSILDLLYIIYNNFIGENNYFILSKGHASLGLYAILEHFNLLDEDLLNFCKFNSKLGGHPTNKLKNVFASTGSLGHGLPIGVGVALGEKIKKTNKKVYVIIGDGESNEGTIWESALIASHHKLDNLYCIMDYNRSNDRALKLDNIVEKFKSFNWECCSIDGHNHTEIEESLNYNNSTKPKFILANTIKGKGITFMENNPEWHHKSPNKDELEQIIHLLK